MNFEKRQKALRSWIRKHKLDGLLVTNLTNVRYLCGFTGSNGTILMTRDGGRFFTDGRYRDQAAAEVVGLPINVSVGKSLPVQMSPFLPKKGRFLLGFESEVLTVVQHGLISEALGDAIVLEPIHSAVQTQRLRKDADEIALIKHAAGITMKVYDEVLKQLRIGVTEKQIQRLIRCLMEDLGAEGESFDTIVLFGKRTALVHGQPGDTPLQKNDLILMDFGAKYQGYCSDFTRTLCFGKPSPSAKKAFNLVKGAVQAVEKKIAPGVECSDLERLVRNRFQRAGQIKKYLHSLGHGVGMQIHEAPRLSLPSTTTLKSGMVVTVEPGLYSGQWGGVRLENLVLITKDKMEILTPAPMELDAAFER